MKKHNQWILSFIEEDGRPKLDIRFWKATPTGGMPTNQAISIDRRDIIGLIIGLQKAFRVESRRQAKAKTKVTQG
jgi:hypothetical protein